MLAAATSFARVTPARSGGDWRGPRCGAAGVRVGGGGRVSRRGSLPVCGQHWVWLRDLVSKRDAKYLSVEFLDQTVDTISLMYVLLGNSGFGAVEWR